MKSDTPTGILYGNKWLIVLAVMSCTIMEVMDGTVVNVSLRHIAGSLSTSVDEATWVLTSYAAANAIVMPITGWLSTYFGRRRLLMACIIIFITSSMLCGVAQSLNMLIVFRIIQGMGGGVLQPLSMAIMLETFPLQKRGMAMAVWGIGVVLAPIVGPLLGGWLADNISWRWSFFINLPICLLSLTLTVRFIFDPEYIRGQRPEKIDYVGLALLCLGIGALQVLLDRGQEEDWFSSAFIIRLAVISTVALITLIYYELKKTDHPVLDLRLLEERNYTNGTIIMFFFNLVRSGSIVLLPLFLQTLMGYDATLAGWALAYGGLGSLLLLPVVGHLTSRVDSRVLVLLGLGLNAYAVYVFGTFNAQIDFEMARIPRLLQGLGMALTFVPLTTLAMCCIPEYKMSHATGLFNMLRNLGGSFGIAMTETLLVRRTQFHQSRLAERATPYSLPFDEWQERMVHIDPDLGDAWDLWDGHQALARLYSEVQGQAWMQAFCDEYWLFTLIFLALIPLVFLMRHEPGLIKQREEV